MDYDKKTFMKKFGEKIKFYRNSAGLTQDKLAEMCNCSAQTISGAEIGYSFPNSDTLFLLSQALNVPIAYLLNVNENDNLATDELYYNIKNIIQSISKEKRDLLIKLIYCFVDKS